MPIQFPSFFNRSKQATEPVQLSMRVVEEANTELGKLLTSLDTCRKGLTGTQVRTRLKHYGFNETTYGQPSQWYLQLLSSFNSPFVYLLVGLALVSYLTEDLKATILLTLMVALSGGLRFMQEYRSSQAAEKLKVMVSVTATVSRLSEFSNRERRKEIPLKFLVPGDIIHLSAGDMVPADVRLLTAKNLFVSQAMLTRESAPVQKHDTLGNQEEKMASPTTITVPTH
jgi:Mg2+-importing ATPase